MNTEYGPRNPERDIDRQWESEDIIETKDMNRIENQVRMLTNHTIWDDELGDTIQRDSEPPRKINVKEMSSTAGGITPTPPSEEQDKSILFADGYNQINVSHSIDNTNNKQDFTIYRSYGTPGTGNLASFSIGAASTNNIGLMSSTDKTRLDTIWDGKLQNNATIVTSSNFTDQLQTIGVVSTTANGLAPMRDGSTTKFLRADGTWSTINYSDVTNAVGKNTNPSLSAIELFPGSTAAGHGGYIDFHYNNSNADYTSRIIELSSGVLTINEQVTVNKSNGNINTSGAITASSFSGNGASLTNLSGYNITSGTVAAAYIGAHNHSTSNITSGVLPISYGGTGMNTRYQYVNLATVSYAEKANYEIPLGYPLSDYKLMIIEVFANSSNNNTNIVYFTFSVPILINGDNGHTTDSHISIATSSHYRTFYYVTGTNIIYFDGADSNTNLIPRRIWGVN